MKNIFYRGNGFFVSFGGVALAVLATFFVAQAWVYAQATWTGPSGPPPTGNPPGFIYNSNNLQSGANMNIDGTATATVLRGREICFVSGGFEDCRDSWGQSQETSTPSFWQLGNNNSIYYNDGNVGIGTNDPPAKLSVNGDAYFSDIIFTNKSVYAGDDIGVGRRICFGGTCGLDGEESPTGEHIYSPRGQDALGQWSLVLSTNFQDRMIISGDVANGTAGNVGIGTMLPQAKLHIYSELQNNQPLILAGLAMGDGSGSIAMGHGAVASGLSATAIGTGVRAEGRGGVALGISAYSKGKWSLAGIGGPDDDLVVSSIAIGEQVTAEGRGATSIGTSNVSKGLGAIAIGEQSSATGRGAVALGTMARAKISINDNPEDWNSLGSIAIGEQVTAEGRGATSIGTSNVSKGLGAIAIGEQSSATGRGAVALGTMANAGISNSDDPNYWGTNGGVAIGEQVSAYGRGAVAIGVFAKSQAHGAIVIGNTNNQAVTQSNTIILSSPTVGIGTLSPSAQLDVNGNAIIRGNLTVQGTKNFIQDHPSDSSKQIVYTALESGESGTYTRGFGQLRGGQVTINLPEHFSLVTSEQGITALVTPTAESAGLYVASKNNRQLVIREIGGGSSDATFDYIVFGVRKGYENQPVIVNKADFNGSPTTANNISSEVVDQPKIAPAPDYEISEDLAELTARINADIAKQPKQEAPEIKLSWWQKILRFFGIGR